MPDKSEKFWNRQAKRYDRSDMRSGSVNEMLLSKTRAHLGPGDRALDLGCATGTKTLKLAPAVQHIHGIDSSTEMILLANRKKEEASVSNCSFSPGTIFDDDLAAGTFDVVTAFSLVHLLEDAPAVVQRIHELLKPGGVFISTTALFNEKMTPATRMTLWGYRFMKKLGIFPLHLNVLSASDVEQLARNQGFQVIESETFQHGMTACFVVARKEGGPATVRPESGGYAVITK